MTRSIMLKRAATKLRMAKLILDNLYNTEFMFLEEACEQLGAAARYCMYEVCDRNGIERSDNLSLSDMFSLCKQYVRSFLMFKDLEEQIPDTDNWENCYFTGQSAEPAQIIHMYNILHNFANYLDMRSYGIGEKGDSYET